MDAVRQTSYDLDVTLKGRPVEEFMDDLAKRLGKHYGLNDIREAL